MFLPTAVLKFSRIDRKTSVSNKDLRPATLFKKNTQTQVFTCELCKILKIFSRPTPVAVAAFLLKIKNLSDIASAIKTKS